MMPTRHDTEDAAARMQRGIERDERRRLEKRRVVLLAVGLALAGVVLLGGGMAALGRAEAPAARAEAPRVAEATPAQEPSPAPTVSTLPNEEPAASTPTMPAAPAAAEVTDPRPKKRTPTAPHKATATAKAPQRLSIGIGTVGYEPSVVTASSKSPIVLSVGKGEGCAAGFLMPSLGVNKDNSRGRVTFSLGRLKRGSYRFTCGMGMVEGRLVVR